MRRISKAVRSRMMGRVKTSGTAPEMAVRRHLRSMGLGYRANVRDLPGKPDIVLRGSRTVIFVHGCFWHSCPRCGRIPKTNTPFWEKKFRDNIMRDRRAEEALMADGWEVIVVWECETAPGGAMADKLSALGQRRGQCRTRKRKASPSRTVSSTSRGSSTRRRRRR